MITSTHNPKIQWVRGLQSRPRDRREAQAFVVEGVRLVEEALAASWPAQLLLYTEDVSERGQAAVAGFAAQGAPVEQVSSSVFNAASDTQSPQGLLAVLPMRSLPLPPHPGFLFIPDNMRDPGNLGTMLRTVAAAGADGVIIPPGTVDPYSPKVVRSGMGAHFRLPIHSMDWPEIERLAQTAALQVYLAAATEGSAYTQCDFRRPLALLIGGEAEGASPQARRLATASAHIPMPGGSESLNAATAAAILLFEVVRQRAGSPG